MLSFLSSSSSPRSGLDRTPTPTGAAASAAGAEAVGQLAELLVRASWRLRRGLAKELAPLGVTFGQARVMRLLVRAEEPLRMADLAARLEIVPRSVTTMIDALEEAGLAAREADPNDRRSVLVTPTAAGRSLFDRVDRARRASAEDLFGRLTDGQRRTLFTLLSALDVEARATPAAGAGGR